CGGETGVGGGRGRGGGGEGAGGPTTVADPRHEPLVEQRVANGVALFASQVRDHPVQVRRLAENVRTEPTHRTVVQLEHRPIPEHGLALGASQDQPRPAEELRTSLVYLPAAR